MDPFIPRVRLEAVKMVQSGKGVRETARYFGVQPSTVSRWVQRAPEELRGRIYLPTRSSRPQSHPRAVSPGVQQRIIELRLQKKRCAEVIHKYLEQENLRVSLSTVKRVLNRFGLLKKKSKWKKYHVSPARPEVQKPGDLVQIDTIHMTFPQQQGKIYIYTLLDVFSRFSYAIAVPRISAGQSVDFWKKAKKILPFAVQCLQSDHGPEFSAHFSRTMKHSGMIASP